MPTTLPRTQVTHTEVVRHALDIAEERWPGQSPGALLLRLIEAGAQVVEDEMNDARRQERVRLIAGRYPGLYGPGYLDQLREGWPE
ncbi:hypothetical protein [Cellulomonas sp. NPDC089187]|uniref:hypothetical protein n=1 Tax=Cellulomonas sp. NPDC089187 TaxID=3154970 RepID=UPI00342F02D2